ncbi:MAG: hypothetical protein LBC84_09160 [Prevotellaceae bacterium]|jgi:hypothetical protein|nr:hypothetical protein [Prevotellaceae bacterium]
MKVNLDNTSLEVITGNDNIVVVDVSPPVYSKGLDVTGWPLDYIPGGHLLIKTTAGEIKPMPLNPDKTGLAPTLPDGHKYVGFQNGSILKSKPYGAVIVNGVINNKAAVFPILDFMWDDIKEALPHIVFVEL